jgi:hypothetical protein
MKVYQKTIMFLSMLFAIGFLIVAVSPVMAYEVLIWDEYVLGIGGEVVSPILEDGKLYRIVADEIWWYNDTFNNLVADAQYYTTDPSNNWYWGNHFPAPGGHSFLQINGQDVDWGPFSNGDTGHAYTIYYAGEGATITFRIVDWIDDDYGNNDCKIRVRIYKSVTVGGYVVDSNPFEVVGLWIIGAVTVVLITVPMVKYYWKTHRG